MDTYATLEAPFATGDAGRIKPSGWIPPDGEYAMCIGSDTPGRFELIDPVTRVRFEQTADFDDATIVRFRTKIRGQADPLPGDLRWELVVQVDGVTYVQLEVEAGRTRERHDHALNVSALAPGNHTLRFEVRLIGTSNPDGGYEIELPGIYFDNLTFEVL